MDPRKNEIRVGIAVIISIVFLIGGIMWGKGYRLRSSRYHIQVVFDNVGGLENGANVLANGVVKGKVTRISLSGGKVFVDAAIDKSVTLFSDYHVTVESPTVMAGKALSLLPGSKLPPADITMPLNGDNPVGMTEAVHVFQDIANDVQTSLRDLDTLLVNLNRVAADTVTRKGVTTLVNNASEIARTSNEWLMQNRERLTNTVTQAESTLVAVKSLSQNAAARLNGTLGGVDSVTAQMAHLTQSATQTLRLLNEGQGTLGKVLTDSSLYVRLNRTLEQIDSLAVSIRTKGMKQRIVLF
ncbi:MAG TPA: MlaD family protein [bacterium]|jgi:phospholipid/cholesterol/gamma-HCH transport system substrate-binding protein